MQHLSSVVDRIIVGTDFTSLSQTAFEAAVRAARLWGAELHILHAHEEDLYLRGRDGGEDMKGFVDELTSRRSGWLDTLKEAAQGAVTRRGAASDAILAYADAIDAGLIVLGMGGGGGLKRLLTGSTARRVLRRSERPVMTVSAQAFVAPATTRPGEPASPAEAGTFRHILYPTDLTAVSRDGLAAAVQLVRKAGARLTVASPP